MPLGSQSPARAYLAIVTKTISPNAYGQVKWQGCYWTAFCEEEQTLTPDTLVWVFDTSGNKLAVQPDLPE
jgi:membrane protein implicated in regulation of membrane protease activity